MSAVVALNVPQLRLSYPYPEERRARQQAATESVVLRGIKAAGMAAVAVAVGHAGAQTFIPAYANVNFRFKAFWGGAACVAAFAVAGERQHALNLRYSRELEAAKMEAHDAERLARLGAQRA